MLNSESRERASNSQEPENPTTKQASPTGAAPLSNSCPLLLGKKRKKKVHAFAPQMVSFPPSLLLQASHSHVLKDLCRPAKSH